MYSCSRLGYRPDVVVVMTVAPPPDTTVVAPPGPGGNAAGWAWETCACVRVIVQVTVKRGGGGGREGEGEREGTIMHNYHNKTNLCSTSYHSKVINDLSDPIHTSSIAIAKDRANRSCRASRSYGTGTYLGHLAHCHIFKGRVERHLGILYLLNLITEGKNLSLL